jgi:hypothetical protein
MRVLVMVFSMETTILETRVFVFQEGKLIKEQKPVLPLMPWNRIEIQLAPWRSELI